MSAPILFTKLFVPPPRAKIVPRSHLHEQLNTGLGRKLTLVSAPAGFGKTTLVSEWCHQLHIPIVWLSLGERDSDPARFLTYFVAALQTLSPGIGEGVLTALQSPQRPPTEAILTVLLNEMASIPDQFVLVLDDYHLLDARAIDDALAFLLEHLPPQMHLVIATREDPPLPLAQLRARDQLTELRAPDLRFTFSEATEFLNRLMGLNLSAQNVAALETRTEGWVAGLQLAALSMRGQSDPESFIRSFTGSHRFVLDYLMQEVLRQQSESIQNFLLRTSLLDRLCGALCDAVVLDEQVPGQQTLESLERANLFIVPLDNERRWYRYHHLFAELLNQRLQQNIDKNGVADLHIRASQWFEDNGLELEAFQHAAAANDVERTARLIEGKGMPLYFRGALTPVLNWLESLPTTVLDGMPLLWTTYASVSLATGQTAGIEQKLQAAEKALAVTLRGGEPDDQSRELVRRIAAIRATLAVYQNQVETIVYQSRRAMEHLPPDNLLPLSRLRANWTMAMARHFQGQRAVGGRAEAESLSVARASGNMIYTLLATTSLGQIQESENRLYQAADSYRRVLQLAGELPQPVVAEAYLGLARIFYQWNDLDAAEQYGQQGLQLARQFADIVERSVLGELFLARLKLARGEIGGAAALVAQAEQSAREHNFLPQMPEIAGVQMVVLLRQGDVAAAARLAQMYPLPLSQASVCIALGDASAALAILEPLRQQVETMNWQDELLKIMVLQVVAYQARGENEKAAQVLGEALVLTEPGGFIRTFVDEGEPMRFMICESQVSILRTSPHLRGYLEKLLAAFPSTTAKNPKLASKIEGSESQGLVEPLSQRELEVLQLIAQGLSNREISERLFLALSTIKGHSRIIFDKLQVHNRTEAAARARELGLL